MTTLTKETVKIYATCYVLSNKLYLKSDSYEIKHRKENVSKDGTKTKILRKNPEDNLGNVIAEIDTDKIGRDIDFAAIDSAIQSIFNRNNIDEHKLFKEPYILEICNRFDIKIKELVETLMEHKPSVYSIAYVRKYIKPFVISVRNDKILYEQYRQRKYFRPIFNYI